MDDLTEWIEGLSNIEPLPVASEHPIRQAQTMLPKEQVCQFYEMPNQQVWKMEDYGRGIAPDDEGRAEMYVYRRTGNSLKKSRFCIGIIKYAIKVIVNIDKGAETWYRIIVENMYIREFFISEKQLMKATEAFRIFSENGIIFSYTARDALMLLHNYIFSVVGEIKEVPFCPGWKGKKFLYNTDIPMLTNTPFLSKNLIINKDISQKKAFDMMIEKICLFEDEELRLFIILFLHYALIKKWVQNINTLFVLFGDDNALSRLAYMFFQFYNREQIKVNYLYDVDIMKKVSGCKDEIFVVMDKCPDTKYKKQLAEKNLSDIKDYVESGKCRCLCLILSNYGVAEPDEAMFRLTVRQKQVEISDDLAETLGTHISHFVSYLENKFTDLVYIKKTEDNEKKLMYNIFDAISGLLESYYEYIGGENLFEHIKLNSGEKKNYVLQKLIDEAYNDYGGDWICEHFQEIFKKLNLKRLYVNDPNIDFYSEDPFAYITKKYICFREKDFQLFLKYFPREIRKNDILKILKRYEWLVTDNEKRFKKNVWIQGAPRKMIVLHKDFLISFDSVEGSVLS